MSIKKEIIVTVKNARELTGVHYTVNHTGKMMGMQSLSTSCLCNEYCKKYSQNPDLICSHCYAQTQMKIYSNMQKCLQQNTEILTSRVLEEWMLPVINATFFRFEAFGDLNNYIQVVNYFNLCKKNKYVKFALWTKNPHLIKQALDLGYKKPNNLQIVLSSPLLNSPADISKWSFIDKVFTVYDKEFIKENNVNINCGAKNCLTCNKCYRKTKETYINEKLK